MPEVYLKDVEALVLAGLLGAIIGLDRELRGKSAGFRTIMLVTMGSALFAILSLRLAMLDPYQNSDVTRIASNIATGIGFLGAGIIFRTGEDIKGLTTATTIWLAAAIGLAAGMGSFFLAVIATIIAWIVLFILHYVESYMEKFFLTEKYRITWSAPLDVAASYQQFFQGKVFRLRETKISKSNGQIITEWTVRAPKYAHLQVIEKMLGDPRIVALEH